MRDRYRIDSHKLMYHPERVSDWLKGKKTYPIYVELSLTNACNHRCIFCAYSYIDYEKTFMDKDVLISTLKNMADCGIKSVMFSGEGEPTLHPNINEIIEAAYNFGLDTAITTNGSFLNKITTLDKISWIKISLDAGTNATHSYVHGCFGKSFHNILDSIKDLVEERDNNNHRCKIGCQVLLLEENIDEIEMLAYHLRSLGVDYLVIKPFSEHPKNPEVEVNAITSIEDLDFTWTNSIDEIDIIIRKNTFDDIVHTKKYNKCHASDFWCHIDALGDVYPCNICLDDNNKSYGNVKEKPFREIWDNKYIFEPDVNGCRRGCRMDKCNQYLYELKKSPPEHVNFI